MTDMTDAQTTTNQTVENSQDAMLAELLQRFSGKQAAPNSAPTGAGGGMGGTGGTGGGIGGDLLSSLLSNPELLAKIPTIISSVKPLLDMLGSQMGQSSPPPTVQAASVKLPEAASASASVPTIARGKDSDRAALLCAMKPYLSRDRQNAIDHIIKLSRLGDVLKSL
jgi:hypothetical protein